MFDIGFWELVLVSVIALVVLGPERLPGAARQVGQWVRRIRGLAYVAHIGSSVYLSEHLTVNVFYGHAFGQAILQRNYSNADGDFGLLEISAPGITKASGLALVCAELGIEPADVAAFGDMPNDLPMLAWVGHGYAIAQGHRLLTEAGFTLTEGPQHEAVGRTIMRLLG